MRPPDDYVGDPQKAEEYLTGYFEDLKVGFLGHRPPISPRNFGPVEKVA